jgi:Family of unknown function (DUF6515)
MLTLFEKIHVIRLLIIAGLLLMVPVQQLSAQKGGRVGHNGGGHAAPSRSATRPSASSAHNGNFNRPSGNKNVNINNSRQNNVNINVNRNVHVQNNRNTVVRRNAYHPYARPPYRYGGNRYYSYHPYYYHPYRPFAWGPAWHPWGFFAATLATTAIIVAVESQQYHYDAGVFYASTNGGYTAVPAPVGAVVTTMPANTQTVVVNETTNNYYYGGTYYEKSDKGYTVVAPTAGTIVESLPEGGEEVTIGDQKYVKFGETYYQPIQQDGKSVYEVATVEPDK